MAAESEFELPALPGPLAWAGVGPLGGYRYAFTEGQMRGYATAARAPLLERIAELEGLLEVEKELRCFLDEKVATLRAELADFRHAAGVATTTVQALRAELERKTESNDALRADAERYQALRRVLREDMTNAQYDACIDAARAAQSTSETRRAEGSKP